MKGYNYAHHKYRRGMTRDAEALATPGFPAPVPYMSENYTTQPPLERYDPVVSERAALERLVEQSDVIEAADRQWLLVELTDALLDFLSVFTAATEDAELSEPDEDDGSAEGQQGMPPPGEAKSYESFGGALRSGCIRPPIQRIVRRKLTRRYLKKCERMVEGAAS